MNKPLSVLLTLTTLAGCGELPSAGDDDALDVDEVTSALVGGTKSNARKEIGVIDTYNLSTGKKTSCTATLVDPRVVITSAGCVGFYSGSMTNTVEKRYFRMKRTDGSSYPTVQLQRSFTLAKATGSNDVAFVRLVSAVPGSTAKPVTLAPNGPSNGQQVTAFGHAVQGTSPIPTPTKNSVTYNYGDAAKKAIISTTADGFDLGGPRFFGSSAGTSLWGINSKAANAFGSDTIARLLPAAPLALDGIRLLGGTTYAGSGLDAIPPSYLGQPGIQNLSGDFDGDGHGDVAVSLPSGFVMAFGVGNGHFAVMEEWILPYTLWSTKSRIAGDFDGNGMTDIAFVGKPTMGSIGILFSQGRWDFWISNQQAAQFAAWANEPGAYAVAGDFDRDGDSDIALVGGAGWTSVPVAFSNRDGTFEITNLPIPTFPALSRQAGVRAVVGDYDNDGGSDIALVGGAGWTTIPVILSRGGGDFDVSNQTVPSFPGWAAQSPAKVIPGDFDGDGFSDLAMIGGSDWLTAKFALSTGAPGGGFKVVTLPIEGAPFTATTKNVLPLTENARDNILFVEPSSGQMFTYFLAP